MLATRNWVAGIKTGFFFVAKRWIRYQKCNTHLGGATPLANCSFLRVHRLFFYLFIFLLLFLYAFIFLVTFSLLVHLSCLNLLSHKWYGLEDKSRCRLHFLIQDLFKYILVSREGEGFFQP